VAFDEHFGRPELVGSSGRLIDKAATDPATLGRGMNDQP